MSKKKIWFVILIVVLFVIAGTVAAGAYLVRDTLSGVTFEKGDTAEDAEGEEAAELSDLYHILLVGTDSRERGGDGRSDSMILLTVNEESQKMIATSILRDIYVSIPGYSDNRLNASYAFGGMPLLKETLRENFSIDTDKYIQVDFFAFAEIIDLLGGVEISVTEEELPVLNKYIGELNRLDDEDTDSEMLKKAGDQTLDGKQALAYSRIRYVGNGDFERTQRQRTVLTKVFEKAKESSMTQMYKFLKLLLSKVTTNLSEGELWTLIKRMPEYKDYELDQWSIPMEGTYTNVTRQGMAVLEIDFEANKQELERRIHPAEPDETDGR